MYNSDSFERLIQKALETQEYPPIPASLLQQWQVAQTEKAAKWLWILPSLIFVTGIVMGVWLAPLGLGNALASLKLSFTSIFGSLPESTLAWALAVGLAIAVLALDGARGLLRRFK